MTAGALTGAMAALFECPADHGMRPWNGAALLPNLPLFVLGHGPCNNEDCTQHLYTYKREELQLPCSKEQLEREEAASVHYTKLVERKKALNQSASMNKRKFDETGVEEIDDEDSLGAKLG